MRSSIVAATLCLLLAGPAFALGPDPVHPTPAVVRAAADAPLARAERWRGTPYTRSETERVLREALDRSLLRDADLATLPAFQGETDLLRSEALDKRIPVNPYSNSGSGVTGF